MGPTQVVWFKRDLRVDDHEPLARAAAAGPCILLYVFEPALLAGADSDAIHLHAIFDALDDLAADLERRYGAHLTYRVGDVLDVLETLHRQTSFSDLQSHEETGNAATYARDRRVRAWTRERGIRWSEATQFGVVRRLRTRDGWAKRWDVRMRRDLIAPPTEIVLAHTPAGTRPTLAELGFSLAADRFPQRSGSAIAARDLRSFLGARGRDYRSAMSTPLAGADACSRLSVHLAYGSISLKTVAHALRERQADLAMRVDDPQAAAFRQSLKSFEGRLHWHCHFMQKLEDEPRIEFENLARAYDGMREAEFDAARFAAFRDGRTGYPMVDACMRSLRATGWLNFRMRAMLMSFAAYHLWLHWREPALVLARYFTDYEPGIHYSQSQMQSGVTGMNAIRIYSPRKQAVDQDPEGLFIRRWIPEIAALPTAFLAAPHSTPELLQRALGVVVGRDYPAPIVDEAAALSAARARIYAVRRSLGAREATAAIVEKHGSRKPTRR